MDFTEPTSEIDKLSSVLEQMLEEYCLSSEATQDHKIFTINYREKNLLVSIKRYPTSEGVRTVVGSVMEIQEEQPKEAVHKTRQMESVRSEKFSQFHNEQAKNLSEV